MHAARRLLLKTTLFLTTGLRLAVPGLAQQPAPIVATPASLIFNSASAQPAAGQNVTLTNTGTSPVSIVGITPDVSWLSFAITSGSVTITPTSPATLSVAASAGSLANGTYIGHITILASTGPPTLITVTFNVGTGSGLSAIAAPASLAFSYQAGTNFTVPQQLISIGPIQTYAVTVSVGTPQQWLVANPLGNTGPGLVIVSVIPQGLVFGVYQGAVTINSSSGSMTIPVTLTVTANIVVSSSPASVNLLYQPGNPPILQTLTLFASDGSATPVAVSTSTPWIAVQSQTGTTTPAPVQLSINPAGLCNGLNTGAVTIAAPNAANNGFTIPVVVLVGGVTTPGCPGGPLTVTPSALLFSAPANGPPLLIPQILMVSAPSPATTYTVSSSVQGGPNWLTVLPSGALSGNQTLSVTVNQTGLAIGTYTGTISLITNGAMQTVPVTLVVTPPVGGSGLTPNPSTLTFNAQSGQSAGSQTVTLSTTSPTPITILGVSTDAPNYLSAAVTGGFSVSAATPATLTVTATAARLPLGQFIGHVTVNSSAGITTITVTLNVASGSSTGAILANPPTLVFSAPAGQTAPPQSVTLTSATNGQVSITGVTADVSWITVSSIINLMVSPQFPASLSVMASAANLPTGFYVGHITITPSSGAVTVIAVTFLVPPTGGGGTNVSQGKPATQSSNYPGYPTTGAVAAVDGITDGNFYDGSVTATDLEPNPWWQVDLGASVAINSIVIWNRTDCCGSRLNDYWIFVSDIPFLPTDTPATLQFRTGTFSSHQSTAPSPSAIIPAVTQGRYVRVQLSTANYLSLAEVQVIGIAAPLISDLAVGKTAIQSSNYPGYLTAGAGSAVDGNLDGNFFDGSVTATNLDPNPWWQVDLGSPATIGSITIWNRTDCCGSRLNDYWVFVSNTPFLPTDTPATLQSRPGTFSSHQTTAPSPSINIPTFIHPCPPGALCPDFQVQGRYVRVQLSTANYLSLAEVQVFGVPLLPNPNLAQGKPATQSSNYPGYLIAAAGAAVDGNVDGNFFDGSVTATNLDPNPWWQVDLGASATINSVVIWNRTDCCGSRLNDYWVFVSNTPFLPTDTPASLSTRAGTVGSHQTTAPTPSILIGFGGAPGRYVRVQLSNANYLSLAEVLVLGQ